MRLFNSKTYKLHEFIGTEVEEYAILSHTWGHGEVTFQDLNASEDNYMQRLGWKKIEYCCRQAREDSIEWVWVDTVCIDKSSSAELSEAINSMFAWYRDAKVCYAYLADIPKNPRTRVDMDTWKTCRWFSRGWTLQELLAPREMVLFGEGWCRLGTRLELSRIISQVSGIQPSALECGEEEITKFSIAKRMCWASRRETTRPEDIAYCLLGIFGVNIPLLYGEGKKRAFFRLQEEIMKDSDDHTLFAWETHHEGQKALGMLAESPYAFRFSKEVESFRRWDVSETFTMTNKGLKIIMPMTMSNLPGTWQAELDCYRVEGNRQFILGIILKQLWPGGDQYARVSEGVVDLADIEKRRTAEKREIYIRKDIITPDGAFAFREIFHPLREFRLLPIFSTHHLVETYGSVQRISSPDRLRPPPKDTHYWIEPQLLTNWHVVCRYTNEGTSAAIEVSDFIVVLGYNTETKKPWCVLEPFELSQTLREVWIQVRSASNELTRTGQAHIASRSDEDSLVRVIMKLSDKEDDVVDVQVSRVLIRR